MRFFVSIVGSVFITLCHVAAFAGIKKTDEEILKYYGSEFYQGYVTGSLRNEALLTSLNKITAQNHTSLGYDGARKVLFGKLFLEQISGAWTVKEVYCEYTFTNHQEQVGPGLVPSPTVVNTEHTWPQSRFTGRYSKDLQKSDLHHLFPTDTQMNSTRSSLRFGNVRAQTEKLKCPQSQLGHHESGDIVFEVPDNHKGNAARAIFYFATRYQMKLSPSEEADLRNWHQKDPVDQLEAKQNDEIQDAQGNRNPFVDFPDLVDRISSF